MNVSIIIPIWHNIGVIYPGGRNELGGFAARLSLLSAAEFVVEYIILTTEHLLPGFVLCVVGKYGDYRRI